MNAVLNGIDALLAEPERWLGRGHVGLVANQASMTASGATTLEALRAAQGVDLACLLTPEHGFSGYEEDASPIADRFDARTGLSVHSLYGPRRRPDPEVLSGLSAVIFDVQEVGVRCYTYATTLALLLEAAAGSGCRVVVCDRPNLLGAKRAGPSLDPRFRSFLGYLPVPFQHALTIGELATLWARHLGGVELTVATVTGWRRADAPAGPFVPPSPGLPTREAVALYPGLVLLEGTNLSEGRGTTLPFQLIGAPWLEGYELARSLGELNLPGLLFRPLSFRPDSGKYAHQVCHGAQLHVTDFAALRAFEAALRILATVRSLHREHFEWVESASLPWAQLPGAGEVWHEPVTGLLVDYLAGSADARAVVEGRLDLSVAVEVWREDAERFSAEARRFTEYGA